MVTLGELQDNGGSTLTVALLEGSLAIDAGSNDLNLVNDQRGEGFSRTVGAATDIGAFEFQDSNIQVPDVQVPDIQINDGHNEIYGENGQDTLFGGEGNETLIGGAGDDLLVGAAGHDSLLGSNGHDVINGEEGDDLINGDEGDDLLTGGAGSDTLIGGAGHDVFVLEASDIHDMIVDFELGSDRLQLSESLSLGQLSIVDNESNTGSLIIDSNNHDAVIASVENVHAVNLSIHLFC